MDVKGSLWNHVCKLNKYKLYFKECTTVKLLKVQKNHNKNHVVHMTCNTEHFLSVMQ